MRSDTSVTPQWLGDPNHDPGRDPNHDGHVSAEEAQFAEYERVVAYHKAKIDWINNYGPPRRARLGFTVGH